MKIKNALLLLLTASIWGATFVAQSVGIDYVGPLTFNCVRCLMGGVVLLPCIWFSDRKDKRKEQVPVIPGARKTLIIGGICRGMALCLVSNFQQSGTQHTTVGRAGFIIAYYIVIVPVLGLLSDRKCSPVVAGAVVLSLAGLYMLYMEGGELSVNKGDLFMLVCASLFAVYIMIIDSFSPVADGVRTSYIQFFVSGILSGAVMLTYETPEWSQIMAAWVSVLYVGITSCGMAYTLQIVRQKGMNPTVASLILNLESGILILAGWVTLGQKLFSKEVLGCALMFSAIILVQILVGRRRQASLNTEGNQGVRYRRKPVSQKAAGVTECSQLEISQPETSQPETNQPETSQ